jgi:hypothetical protein
MFGLRRHKTRHATERCSEVFAVECGQQPSTEEPEIYEPAIDESTTGDAESSTGDAEVEPRYIETAADLPFLAVIADLDTSLTKLSGICDRLEAAIESWSMPAWDPMLPDVTMLDETAMAQLVA